MSATDELRALDQRHAEAVAARRAVDADERAAYDAVREAEAELEGLLAQKMAADEPPGRAVSEAEKRLDKAREGVRREWALERQAADRVVRQRDGERYAYVEQNAADLLAAEHEAAEPLAREMDALASRVIELRAQLAAAEQRVTKVVHLTRPGEERLVTQPRSDRLVQEAQALLAAGGERSPAYEPQRVVAIGEVG
jgi:hypothetical protein